MSNALAVPIALLLSAASPAIAAIVQSADELCAPGVDPCVVETVVETDSSSPLDFGTRTVRVQGSGAFRGSLDLRCGRFVSDVESSWMDVPEWSDSRDVSVLARRGCSLNPSYPCFDDTVCADLELGSCSVGNGDIYVLRGRTTGNGASVSLRGVGGVQVFDEILVEGSGLHPQGGTVRVESGASSVRIQTLVRTHRAAAPLDPYGDHDAGVLEVRATGDIVLSGRVAARGGRGRLVLQAGGDVRISAAVQLRGADDPGSPGGSIDIAARGDIDFVAIRPGRPLRLNVTGGTEGSRQAADGSRAGSIEIGAGGSIRVAPEYNFRGDGGLSRGYRDDHSYAADVALTARDDLIFEGRLVARGRGLIGYTEPVTFSAGGDLRLTPTSKLFVGGYSVAYMSLSAAGAVQLDGLIESYGESEWYGETRYGYNDGIGISGRNVSVAGEIRAGAVEANGALKLSMYACSLHLEPTAKLDVSLLSESDGMNLHLRVNDSLRADAGSVMLARQDAAVEILYGPAADPLTLDGSIDPAPSLQFHPDLQPCAD